MIFKRINRIIAAAGLALAITGCMGVGDDLSDCVWENVTLTFHYQGSSGEDLFPQYIGSVDAFIYDDQNCLVAHERFDQAALDEFRGWKLILPSGRYRAVCWANVESNSCFSVLTPGTTTFDECCVEIDAAAAATGDPVFYAPKLLHPYSCDPAIPDSEHSSYAFTVPPGQTVVKQMHLVRAHRTLNVYVQGFSDGGLLPTIDVSNLWGQYDFLYNTLTRKVDFTQTSHTVTTADGPADLSKFHFAFGEVIDDEVIVLRRTSDRSVVCTVNLKEFIDGNPAAYRNDIDVMIRFTDLGTIITIPGWLDKPITPGV